MAFFVFRMPADMILASAVVGLIFAASHVVWLIVAAVFLYDIAVTTGQSQFMKASCQPLERSPAPGSPGGLLKRHNPAALRPSLRPRRGRSRGPAVYAVDSRSAHMGHSGHGVVCRTASRRVRTPGLELGLPRDGGNPACGVVQAITRSYRGPTRLATSDSISLLSGARLLLGP